MPDACLRPGDAKLLAPEILVMPSVTVINVMGNNFDPESAKMLIEVAKQKSLSLCGIQRDQTIANFHFQGLKPVDAILLASDLSQADVTGSLTSLSLGDNNLGDQGVEVLSIGLKDSKSLATLDLSNSSVLSPKFGPKGATALASAIAVMPSLTSLSAASNGIVGDGAQQLASAVLAKPNIDIFSGIPLKELRADSLTTLDLSGRGLGVPEAIVLADLLRSVCASLTKLDGRANLMGEEGKAALRKAAEGRSGIELML